MYYLLYNAKLDQFLQYDELSDYLLIEGWRIHSEITQNELDYPTFQTNQQIIRDIELFNSTANELIYALRA